MSVANAINDILPEFCRLIESNAEPKNKQDASASHQDIVVTSPDDERRTQWENYRRGEGKQ